MKENKQNDEDATHSTPNQRFRIVQLWGIEIQIQTNANDEIESEVYWNEKWLRLIRNICEVHDRVNEVLQKCLIIK